MAALVTDLLSRKDKLSYCESFLLLYRRTPLLRLSPVSTFPRLDKLGRFKGLRSLSRDSGESKPWGLVASLEFLERYREKEREREREKERERGNGLENIAPDIMVRLGLVRLV